MAGDHKSPVGGGVLIPTRTIGWLARGCPIDSSITCMSPAVHGIEPSFRVTEPRRSPNRLKRPGKSDRGPIQIVIVGVVRAVPPGGMQGIKTVNQLRDDV